MGEAELEVVGPCDPCNRMETALGPGALARMQGWGGVVTRIVRDGLVRRGDPNGVTAGDGPLFTAAAPHERMELNSIASIGFASGSGISW